VTHETSDAHAGEHRGVDFTVFPTDAGWRYLIGAEVSIAPSNMPLVRRSSGSMRDCLIRIIRMSDDTGCAQVGRCLLNAKRNLSLANVSLD
jgi:hypothetical protein